MRSGWRALESEAVSLISENQRLESKVKDLEEKLETAKQSCQNYAERSGRFQDRCEALEAAAGQMRAGIEELVKKACDCVDFDTENQVPVCHSCNMELDSKGNGHGRYCLVDLANALGKTLSSDCGKGWKSPEVWKIAEDARKSCQNLMDCRPDRFGDLHQKFNSALVSKALAAAGIEVGK